MNYICPLMTVTDIERSKRFYQDILGQNIKEDYGQNVVFEGDFSIHQKDHYASLLGEKEITAGKNNFELYFEDNNLESLQLKLKNANVAFVHKLKTQPWQQQALRIYDPDNNMIEIGESMIDVCKRLNFEGKSNEEIMKLTSLPLKHIHRALEKKQ